MKNIWQQSVDTIRHRGFLCISQMCYHFALFTWQLIWTNIRNNDCISVCEHLLCLAMFTHNSLHFNKCKHIMDNLRIAHVCYLFVKGSVCICRLTIHTIMLLWYISLLYTDMICLCVPELIDGRRVTWLSFVSCCHAGHLRLHWCAISVSARSIERRSAILVTFVQGSDHVIFPLDYKHEKREKFYILIWEKISIHLKLI